MGSVYTPVDAVILETNSNHIQDSFLHASNCYFSVYKIRKGKKTEIKGVSDMLLTWLRSYLHGRYIKVVLSGKSSDASPINASVPQGSILHPLLFSVFIDDLVDTSENQLYLYAHDSTLLAPIRSVNERASVFTSLNRDPEKMRVWAAKWKVTFEPTKCKALMLCRKRTPAIPDLYFGNANLAVETELSIIGVNQATAWTELAIPSLQHRREVAVVTVL